MFYIIAFILMAFYISISIREKLYQKTEFWEFLGYTLILLVTYLLGLTMVQVALMLGIFEIGMAIYSKVFKKPEFWRFLLPGIAFLLISFCFMWL